jgi:hypothetical protein
MFWKKKTKTLWIINESIVLNSGNQSPYAFITNSSQGKPDYSKLDLKSYESRGTPWPKKLSQLIECQIDALYKLICHSLEYLIGQLE